MTSCSSIASLVARIASLITGGVQYAWTFGPSERTFINSNWPLRRASIESVVDFLPEESVPATPTNRTATPDGTSAINLSWDAPDDGGLLITGYQILVSADPPSSTAGTCWWTTRVRWIGHSFTTAWSLVPPATTGCRRATSGARAHPRLSRRPRTWVRAATSGAPKAPVLALGNDTTGFTNNPLAPAGSSIDHNSFMLGGTSYAVSGLINMRTEDFTSVQFAFESNLPPASAVGGLSLYVGGVARPFSEAQRNISSSANKFYSWEDPVNFGTDNTIFTDEGTVDLRIGTQFVNVVTIAAVSATVDNDTYNDAEFTLTRAGSLANPLLVQLSYPQLSYPQLSADARSCADFAAGVNTTPAKDFQFSSTAGTKVTFDAEEYPEDEMCNYAGLYRVDSPSSATVTVVE